MPPPIWALGTGPAAREPNRWIAVRVFFLLTAALAAGCNMPSDPDGTLDRVRGGTLRAGLSVRDPWTRLESGKPAGVEAALIQEFAAELGAKVEWKVGGESELLQALERRELDVVAGGLTADTPWQERVGLTGSYLTEDGGGRRAEHVLAVPPGENGWLVALERFLFAREDHARELLRKETAR